MTDKRWRCLQETPAPPVGLAQEEGWIMVERENVQLTRLLLSPNCCQNGLVEAQEQHHQTGAHVGAAKRQKNKNELIKMPFFSSSAPLFFVPLQFSLDPTSTRQSTANSFFPLLLHTHHPDFITTPFLSSSLSSPVTMVITATQVEVDEILECSGEKVCPLFNTWTSNHLNWLPSQWLWCQWHRNSKSRWIIIEHIPIWHVPSVFATLQRTEYRFSQQHPFFQTSGNSSSPLDVFLAVV